MDLKYREFEGLIPQIPENTKKNPEQERTNNFKI